MIKPNKWVQTDYSDEAGELHAKGSSDTNELDPTLLDSKLDEIITSIHGAIVSTPYDGFATVHASAVRAKQAIKALIATEAIKELQRLRQSRTNHTHPIGKGSVSSSYIACSEVDVRIGKLQELLNGR